MADPEFARVLKEAAPMYLKGYTDQTIRGRYLLGALARKGRITYNKAGSFKLYWNVRARQHSVESYGDDGVIDFGRTDNMEQLSTDWRGYRAGDRMTIKEYEMLRGTTQIVNRYNENLPELLADTQDAFCGELWIDGGLAANVDRIDGIKTFLGYDSANTLVGDIIAPPDDTYACKNTDLEDIGGSWSNDLNGLCITRPNASLANDYPDGNGTSDYNYLSPIITNYLSTSWIPGSGINTWEGNCDRVLSRTVLWLRTNGGERAMPDMHMLGKNLYAGFRNHMADKFRIEVPFSTSDDLGMKQTPRPILQHEGVPVECDFDVPPGEGFTLNCDQMELACLGDTLFRSEGPTWDPKGLSWLWNVLFFGNVRWNPRHFAYHAAIAGS